jgi:hypothetical protein
VLGGLAVSLIGEERCVRQSETGKEKEKRKRKKSVLQNCILTSK